MRQHRRAAVLIAAAVAAPIALAACGGSGGAPQAADFDPDAVAAVTDEDLEGTTIEMARFFGDCTDDYGDSTDLEGVVGECGTIQTLTNQFNEQNEYGITVERLGGAAWDAYYDQLNSTFAGDNPPDVAIMHGSSLVDYAERDLLVPLDELAPAVGVDLDDAVPAAQEATAYDGSTYAVPFDLHAGLAHVNVDLFREAGLVDEAGMPVLPTSPEELMEAAQAVDEATGKDFLAVARVGDQLGVHVFESLLGQQGGAVLNVEDGTSSLDSPEALKALEVINTLTAEGYTDGEQTYDAAQEAFLAGDAAMLFNGTWVVDQYVNDATFEYAAMNFPTLFDEPAVWADSHTWTVPAQPDADPAQYRAAVEFIAFLYENDEAWALGTGHIAARQSVLESESYQAAPQRANYAETGLTNARLVPHTASWPAVADTLRQSLESVWFEDADPAETLENASTSIEATIEQ